MPERIPEQTPMSIIIFTKAQRYSVRPSPRHCTRPARKPRPKPARHCVGSRAGGAAQGAAGLHCALLRVGGVQGRAAAGRRDALRALLRLRLLQGVYTAVSIITSRCL